MKYIDTLREGMHTTDVYSVKEQTDRRDQER